MEANYNLLVVFAIHWHESATGVHVSPVRKWNLNSPVIIWLKMTFYDKYIIQNRVFLYAFHQRESENAKLALKNQHLRVSVLNSQLTWVKLSLEVKGFCRITRIMLKLVLEPVECLSIFHINWYLLQMHYIFVTSTNYKRTWKLLAVA